MQDDQTQDNAAKHAEIELHIKALWELMLGGPLPEDILENLAANKFDSAVESLNYHLMIELPLRSHTKSLDANPAIEINEPSQYHIVLPSCYGVGSKVWIILAMRAQEVVINCVYVFVDANSKVTFEYGCEHLDGSHILVFPIREVVYSTKEEADAELKPIIGTYY